MYFCLLCSAEQSSAKAKERKKLREFFFGIPQLAEEQCFIKCHNVPESFIKISVGLFLS